MAIDEQNNTPKARSRGRPRKDQQTKQDTQEVHRTPSGNGKPRGRPPGSLSRKTKAIIESHTTGKHKKKDHHGKSIEKVLTPEDSKQCISCGKRWPWVTFNIEIVHHTSNVCTRCARPDLEAERWKEIGLRMQKDLKRARERLAQFKTDYPTSFPSKSTVTTTTSFPDQPLPVEPTPEASGSTVPISDLPPFHIPPPHRLISQTLTQEIPMKHQPLTTQGYPPSYASLPVQAQQPPQQPSHQNHSTAIHQQVLSDGVNRKRLSEKQLNFVFANPHILKKVTEPYRAEIWLQLMYKPTTSDKHIRQRDLYDSYIDFIGHTQSQDIPPVADGNSLVMLAGTFWQDLGVRTVGKPYYTISGLEVRHHSPASTAHFGDQPINHNVTGSLMLSPIPFNRILQQSNQTSSNLSQQPSHHNVIGNLSFIPTPTDYALQQSHDAAQPIQISASEPNLQSLAPRLQAFAEAYAHFQRQSQDQTVHLPSTVPSSSTNLRIKNAHDIQSVAPNTKPPISSHHQQSTAIADVYEVEDDWNALRPSKKAKMDHVGRAISTGHNIVADLSVQPRPGRRSDNSSQQSRAHTPENEEIDELDDDEDVVMPENANSDQVKDESRDQRAVSEEEVGDLLL
ncbi:uncharacterized protein L201_006991 [Kwoniella dendrophila CBS 6074]|uniref:GATA-type domain-containing protein n=1 Tax=Kwoniella dendrophila CBS 6074 TaxID=1295534 RepID=A0AAX4K5A5_9TREE